MVGPIAPVRANLDAAVLALKTRSTLATHFGAVTLVLAVVAIRRTERVQISTAVRPGESGKAEARALDKIANSPLVAIVQANLPFAGFACKTVLTRASAISAVSVTIAVAEMVA